MARGLRGVVDDFSGNGVGVCRMVEDPQNGGTGDGWVVHVCKAPSVHGNVLHYYRVGITLGHVRDRTDVSCTSGDVLSTCTEGGKGTSRAVWE